MRFHYIMLILFLSSVNQSNAFGTYFYCKFKECCEEPWIRNDIYNLTLSLYKNVFGQHLVREYVPKMIETHLTNQTPQKPLVLSFHGGTGTGKNWVSQLIAENLYSEGFSSQFVKYIHVPMWFRDTLRTQELTELLHHRIVSSLNKCKQTLFIFDDIHAMNPQILDELLPYINNPLPLDGIEFRKAIYIFISNSGSTKINDYLTNQLLNGRERDSIGQKEMHTIINEKIYGEKGAFKNTDFVSRKVIDAAIPFLPLEKTHVGMCIEKAFLERGQILIPSMVTKVLEDIVFVPEGVELFSQNGCKRINQIINDLID